VVESLGARVKAIVGSLFIDGTGGESLRDAVVLVEGDKISDVGPREGVTVPREAQVIDGTGMTVMPGLIDSHIHLTGRRRGDVTGRFDTVLSVVRAISDAQNILEHGVTAARCCGSPYTPAIKKAIEEGTIQGPRLITAGSYISQTFGHGDVHSLPLEWVKDTRVIADGVAECRRAVREQLRRGADFIKVMAGGGTGSQLDELEYPQFSPEELRAMVYEAHCVGKRVAAHAHGQVPITHALACGVDCIEHGTAISEEAARTVAESGRFIVRNCYTPIRAHERTNGFTEMAEYTEWGFRRQKINYEHNKTTVRLCRELGVKQAIGPDVGGSEPYDGIPNTLWAFMELGGYTAQEAISCCTKTGSEVLCLDDQIGTLEKGKLADLIVVDGNPLEDVKVLIPKENIKLVMKGGKAVVNRGLNTGRHIV
jgi:imidazolonepropionase-like amidohydrolase